jgi:hypothetical protein
MSPLNSWSKSIIATSAQCFISRAELASEAGLSMSYLSRLLFEKIPQTARSKQKVESALKTCVERKGVRFEDVYP